ncbi:MAG: acetoacetate--CoA ligase [Bdellovibrionota bacterium]
MFQNAIVWTPAKDAADVSQMAVFERLFEKALARTTRFSDFEEFCDASITHKDEFWTLALRQLGVSFDGDISPAFVPGTEFFDAKWFTKLRLSYAENLVGGMPEEGAVLVALTERPEIRREWTKAECIAAIAALQNLLRQSGIVAGDRVAAVLPNCPETVLAMLAVNGLGAIWSSCSPDFGEQGILDRFQQIDAKFLFLAQDTIYNGKLFDLSEKNRGVLAKLPSVKNHHVFRTLSTRSSEALNLRFLKDAQPEFVRLPFEHPLFIMFSSGTTGAPKCIVHGAGGSLLQLIKEHKLHCDIRPGEKVLYYTTCGWMMWNWLATSLASGARVYCYEGSPAAPEPDSLWRLIDAEKIEVFGTSAKFIGSCRTLGLKLDEGVAFEKLRLVLSTGSALLPEDFDYFYSSVQRKDKPLQLASIAGGTDIISCFMLANPLKPVRRGEIQSRGLGMDVQAFDENGQAVRDEQGELVCATPFPSMPVGFWKDDDRSRYRKSYFSTYRGVWHHGDYVIVTSEGGIVILGRSDATLNPGGVRIGTAEIYRQVETHPLVADSLAVGRKTEDDEEIVLFVKLKDPSQTLDDELRSQIRKRIREGASPRHVPKEIYSVAEIPYTVSGKKVEIAVKRILQGQDPGNREALANPASLDLYTSFRRIP